MKMCFFIFLYSAADSSRAMQEQMASGGGMMGGPQADPQKAFEVKHEYFLLLCFKCVKS